MTKAFEKVNFQCGQEMKNCFMLAPLTNMQSHADGTLSDEEIYWLSLRAQGGFGLTMTAAAHVQAVGQGFPGQLGIFSDKQVPGLSRLAAAIKAQGSLAVVQLHHAGIRSPQEIIGRASVGASAEAKTGSRELSNTEVKQLVADFVSAAVRAKTSGFDGVELHAAHNYIICQFLSDDFNHRTDEYGGSLENRCRLLFEIISGIRECCGSDFILGVRLSPERHGILLMEAVETANALFLSEQIDFLDLSLWDIYKEPVEAAYQGRSLMSYFTDLPRGPVKLGVAGKIHTSEDVAHCLDNGSDFVLLGRMGILHHNYPRLLESDPGFTPVETPVSRDHLQQEGLSEGFINYMNTWKGFVSPSTDSMD